jgi:hypothetical protein
MSRFPGLSRRGLVAAVGASATIAPFVTIGVGVVSAHETPSGSADRGVAFALLVGFVVVTGLLVGGAIAERAPRWSAHDSRATALLLVVLGGWSLAHAAVDEPALAVAGALVGAGATAATRGVRGTSAGGRGGHTDLDGCAEATFGAVSVHRALEGGLLASIYAASAALGLIAAAVFAAHAAAETGAVAALYATGGRRSALAAAAGVQLAFVGGAVAGAAVATAVPPGVRSGVVAAVGGVLVTTGILRAGRTRVRRRPSPA